MYTELRVTIGTSRARDTYGYPMLTLTDTNTGKRYRTLGGNYDKEGTVLAEYLQEKYQIRLRALANRAGVCNTDGQFHFFRGDLYGMVLNIRSGEVLLDGGCGFSALKSITAQIGLSCEELRRWRGKRCASETGFKIRDNWSNEKSV
jgi:hypothetical protein